MRKVFTVLLVVMIGQTFGQNNQVTIAYNNWKDGLLDEAAQAIEPATTHEKTSVKEKTFRYRGNIYQEIATSSDEALRAKYPNALKLAVESFLKANELDTKGEYKKENVRSLGALQGFALNAGNDEFGKKNYAQAVDLYGLSQQIAQNFNMVDTNAIFNQALAYESAGDKESAISKYKSLIEMDYNRPEIYRYLSSLQKKNGDLEGAIATAKAGMDKYPNNKDIILDNMAFLLEAGKSSEAESLVGVAIEKDPQNAVLYSVQGSLYDQKAAAATTREEVMEWYDKAEASYKKSIEIDEQFFDAYFNIGVLYNNRAAYIYDEIKDIKSDSEYMKAKKEADDIFLAAVPFFEKAHEIQPEDQQTIAQLVKLYGKTGDEDKYKVMKAKLAE